MFFQLTTEGFKLLGCPQQALIEEIEQGPEVGQIVFHRCACHGDAHVRGQLFNFPGLLCQRIFDGLSLIQNHTVPVNILKPFDPGRHPIGGDRQKHRLLRQQLLQSSGGLAVEELCVHVRGKTYCLLCPIAQQGSRNDQQHSGLRPFHSQVFQITQHLHRFSKAHIVRQTGPKAQAVHISEPGKASLLIGTQCGLEACWQYRSGNGLRRT